MSDMTREEAISTLEMLRFPEPWEQKLSKRAEEALDMAISALSENKGDLVSRQAVIDELNKWDWQELYLPIHFKENIIDVLPSVQPKKEDNTMDIYSDLLRVKHGTMSIDSLIDKVWFGRKVVNK